MTFLKIFLSSVLLLTVSACATGLWSNEPARAFPPLDPGKGRVFFYRSSAIGSAYTPDVLLNGERVGKLDRRGVFFKDVLPGSYAVTTTMTAKVANFSLRAGERKYVKFISSLFETHMHAELVDPAKGAAEVSTLD
jgi:hypothetical protein